MENRIRRSKMRQIDVTERENRNILDKYITLIAKVENK